MKTIRTKIYDLIDKNEQEIKDQIKSLEGVYNAAFVEQEKYLKKQSIEIDKIFRVCDEKLSHKEAQRLWRQFSRFAEYEDLRDLYQRCIPEISKFE